MTKSEIDHKIKKLAELLTDMAHNDMGELPEQQAAMFHNARDSIDILAEMRGIYREDKQ